MSDTPPPLPNLSQVSGHPITAWLQPTRLFIHRSLRRLPLPLAELILFGLKMAWSCLFGAIMLGLMILTHWIWPKDFFIHRYDALFYSAVLVQILMLITRLESLEEAKVIGLYHLIGTLMEIFKTHMGSWIYPEPSLWHIGGVPLFTGFMYGTIGSFIARSMRIFDMRFIHYPRPALTYGLAFLAYINFFTHHFILDIRWGIYGLGAILFWRTRIEYRIQSRTHKMPFLLAGSLTAFFVWIAENLGTLSHTWLYPNQTEVWHLVSLEKMGAWGLLLLISFVCVSLVIRPNPEPQKAT